MRERLLAAGAAALPDYELLEMLLFLGIPRRDTKPLAKAMINRFGSLAAVLSAPSEALRAVGELTAAAIAAIGLVDRAAGVLAGAEAEATPVMLGNWEQLADYLDAFSARAEPAGMRALFLNSRNRLLADEAVAVADQTLMVRAILERSLALDATALFLLTRRGGGRLTIGKADRALTLALERAVGVLAVVLHDHVVMGPRGDWLSLRRAGWV